LAPTTVSVHLELDAEPIAGEVRAPGLEARRFSGWMELFASLEALLSVLRGAAPTPRRDLE
jgi:hypothetical protein